MPSWAENVSVSPHALSSVVAKWFGESTWAWSPSPATASGFSSFPAYSPSHVLMILPNRFESLLMLPALTASSEGLVWFPVPVLNAFPCCGCPRQTRALLSPSPPLSHCCTTSIGTGTYPSNFHLFLPWALSWASPAQSSFGQLSYGSWECPLWEIFPRTSQIYPIFRRWCDRFL